MNNDHLVSIIVPIYNTEKYLRRCIESIIGQTLDNIEIILVDDGSNDGSSSICDEYYHKDKRIKVIHKENGGVSSARNKGIEVSTGRYIGFIDSDDWAESNMFEVLYKQAIKYDCDISVCGVYESEYEKDLCSEVFVYNKEDFCSEMFSGESFEGYTPNKLFKRSIIKNIRFREDIDILEDLLFIYEILNSNNNMKMVYNTKKLYHYIKWNGSALHQEFTKKSYSSIEAFRYMYEDSLINYPAISNHIFNRYINQNVSEANRFVKANCKEEEYLLTLRDNIKSNYENIKKNCNLSIKRKFTIWLINKNLDLYSFIYRTFIKLRECFR